MNINVDTRAIEAAAKRLGAADNLIQGEVYNTMAASLSLLEQAVVGYTPVNTGVLRGSIATQISGTGVALTGEVMTPLLYGVPVEFGRAPGRMPPPEALELWAVRKLGLAAGSKEAQRAGYLIARSIGRRGTKGAFMFTRAFNENAARVVSLWTTAVARIVAQL